jgi:hypothetical protein
MWVVGGAVGVVTGVAGTTGFSGVVVGGQENFGTL